MSFSRNANKGIFECTLEHLCNLTIVPVLYYRLSEVFAAAAWLARSVPTFLSASHGRFETAARRSDTSCSPECGRRREESEPKRTRMAGARRTIRIAIAKSDIVARRRTLLNTSFSRHSPTMNAAVTNLAFMMGAMQVAKRIPFDENPEYLTYARIVYVAAQVVVLLINYFISMKVSGRARGGDVT